MPGQHLEKPECLFHFINRRLVYQLLTEKTQIFNCNIVCHLLLCVCSTKKATAPKTTKLSMTSICFVPAGPPWKAIWTPHTTCPMWSSPSPIMTLILSSGECLYVEIIFNYVPLWCVFLCCGESAHCSPQIQNPTLRPCQKQICCF